MLAEETRISEQIDLFRVAYELHERVGPIILDEPLGATIADDEVGVLSLDGLVRAVAGLLRPAADAEARAFGLVGEVARRVAPLLLRENGPAERLARLRLAWSKHAEPAAAVDGRPKAASRH